MKSTKNKQTGNAGESYVQGAFHQLGWGVAVNARDDLGTDLFACARNEALVDLGRLIGVQVKTVEDLSSLKAEYDPEGTLIGYWHRLDRDHVQAWLVHSLPHVLALHDLSTHTSYWVQVTEDSVVSTGKHFKILVPRTNTIDAEHHDALLRVAASGQAARWEGSAWRVARQLSPQDLLRHALIVPRVIAPHPNAGHGTAVSPEQAAALLVQGRIRDYDRFAADHDEVPTGQQAVDSPHWSWRFVGALWRRLTLGEVDVSHALVDTAPDPATRAAAAVLAAAGCLETDGADAAIQLLESTLAHGDPGPVDHAWMSGQLARAYVEVGRIDEARVAALEVQDVRQTHPDDLTATAIGGVAAELLYATSVLGQGDVGEAITGLDTTAAWWRAQKLSWGLAALTERSFREWARDTTITWSARDAANDDLLSASLTATYVGDQPSWRSISGLLGQDQLLRLDRHSAAAAAQAGLGRVCGILMFGCGRSCSCMLVMI